MPKSSSFSLVLLTIALFCSGTSAGPQAITSVESSKCLQVRNSNFKDGTAVETSDCNQGAGQQWYVDTSNAAPIRLADTNLQVQFCFDAKTYEKSSQVVIWECNDNPWQLWHFIGDQFVLANNSELCLDVTGGSTANGVQVETYACNGGLNQAWQLE